MTAPSSKSTKSVTNEIVLPTPNTKVESGPVASIDFAHLVEERLIVYGWVLGFAKAVDRASIELDGVIVELAKKAITSRLSQETTNTAFTPLSICQRRSYLLRI